MADIKITFDEVKRKAGEIHACNENLKEDLQVIRNTITSLEAEWESDSSATIRSKIEGMSSKFQNYYDIIESYVQFLNDTANSYEQTESVINTNAAAFE
ncbi:MAG TPA: WXG100 family type VII secretion target [Eubacterium sp.]|nr:WXG100 family type VII secretion target [Eubacterium sp.]